MTLQKDFATYQRTPQSSDRAGLRCSAVVRALASRPSATRRRPRPTSTPRLPELRACDGAAWIHGRFIWANNSALHKHFCKESIWTTGATRYEVVRAIATFVLLWEILFLEEFTHPRRTARRCKLPTGAQVAAMWLRADPEPLVEVLAYDPDKCPRRRQ